MRLDGDHRQRYKMAIVTVAACAGSLLIALPYLRNPAIGGMEAIGPMFGFLVALIIPVIATVIDLALWRNARWKRRPYVDIVTYCALLAVLEFGLLMWPNSGIGILCSYGDANACRVIADRDERDWQTRIRRLIQERALDRLDTLADERCGRNATSCRHLVSALEGDEFSANAEKARRLWCERDPGQACEELRAWLIEKGLRESAIAQLQPQCDGGNARACFWLGNKFVRADDYVQARQAYKQACTLDLRVDGGKSPGGSNCWNSVMRELTFVPEKEMRAEVHEICLVSVDLCGRIVYSLPFSMKE